MAGQKGVYCCCCNRHHIGLHWTAVLSIILRQDIIQQKELYSPFSIYRTWLIRNTADIKHICQHPEDWQWLRTAINLRYFDHAYIKISVTVKVKWPFFQTRYLKGHRTWLLSASKLPEVDTHTGNHTVYACICSFCHISHSRRLWLMHSPWVTEMHRHPLTRTPIGEHGALALTPGMVHSVSGWTRGVQVKLWDPLRMRAIPERLRGAFTTRRYTNPRLPLP